MFHESILVKQYRFISIPLLMELILLTLLACFPAASIPDSNDTINQVNIGILAKRGAEKALDKWQPTADYLSKAIPGYRFQMVPLKFNEIAPAVQSQQVQFILTNSSMYVELEMNHGVSRIATLENNINGRPTTGFGGVIFTRTDNKTINSIEDLKGKRFGAVDPDSFGGYQTAWRELHKMGIEPAVDLSPILFTGTHDQVVHAVITKEIDAGTVRTDTLERMASEGKISLKAIKVLNRQMIREYPFLISTPLYPEWPFARLYTTSNDLSDQVASALLSMSKQHPAAVQGKYIGWTVPRNYQPVHQLQRELRIGSYSHLEKVTWKQVVRQYRSLIIATIVVFIFLAALVLNITRLNRKINDSSNALKQAHYTLEQRVKQRTEELHNALENLDSLNQQQNLILESTAEGIYGIDTDGKTTFINTPAMKMLGYSQEELIGKANHSFIHHSYPDGTPYPFEDCRMSAAIRDGTISHVDNEVLWRKDGSCFPVEYFSSAITRNNITTGAVITFRDLSEHKAAATALTKSKAEFEAIFKANTDAVVFTNTDHIVQMINPATTHLFGYTIEDLKGKNTQILYAGQNNHFVYDGQSNKADLPYEVYYRKMNGSTFIGEATSTRVLDDKNQVIGYISIMRDITLRKNAEVQIRLASTAMETSDAIIITNPTGSIQQVNKAFTTITGYTSEEVLGKNPKILNSGKHPPEFFKQMWSTIGSQGVWKGEIWDRRKNGNIYPEWLTITAVKDSNNKVEHYVATFRDITERKASEAKILHQAFNDTLTDLPNRRLLQDRLKQAISRANRHSHTGAILFLDLDHFKRINDSLGHHIGDILLQIVAKRLLSVLRQEDTAARLGGDEFVILLPEISNNKNEVIIQIQNVAEKVINKIEKQIDIKTHQLHITSSIGIALFPLHGNNPGDLLKHADTALYHAKEMGRNNYQFYLPEMQKIADNRLSLERDLHQAIDLEQLQLHYQPQYDSNHKIIGAEALVRWNSPDRGIVSPVDFIAAAEQSGLIIPIGSWVLRSACQMIKRIEQMNMEPIHIAINISPREFRHKNFIPKIEQIVSETQINPDLIEFEFTEEIWSSDFETTVDRIEKLQTLGITFAADNFGTGYSSLSYLGKLPLNTLKIDRSFVSDISTIPGNAIIVETIISIAQHMGLQVVAEGVETDEQLQFLKRNNCHAFQGFYFCQPVEADELINMLKEANPASVAN
ncbi:MAG: EAL domain-containing protein [Gammaproteobacteria bacterium]|nr:EAL domain-containing protein [Gammaproteobacteria bacterium]